ncbi:MAG: sigma 54-interacting transcriptional regulator [Planctomycetota bacterium]
MPNPPPHSLPDPSLADRFEVVHSYGGGEGWSGAVRVRGESELRFLKILEPGLQIREGSYLASLSHPSVPRVLEIGRTPGDRPYLLREHVAGHPLNRILPLAPEAARELAVQILEVLAYVHLRGVLHLDLKPSNVLRGGDAVAPHYVLLDFGLGQRGRGRAAGGTMVYAAPEVLLGIEPDSRSDLFSLGVLLLVAIRATSHPLPTQRLVREFPRRGLLEVLGLAAQDLPAPFDALLPRLVARQPDRRFADAQEALDSLVGGSGRPSLSLLRPDPIALWGEQLEHNARALPADADLRLEGAPTEDLHALALHAACAVDELREVVADDDGYVLCRGGATQVVFRVPELQPEQLAQHLVDAATLAPTAARQTADALWRDGVTSPAAAGQRLVELVERGEVVPQGPRWIWPEAEGGRLPAATQGPALDTPLALRHAAARGQVEAALRGYRRAAAGLSEQQETPLRAALATGLIEVGEPARALPLVHDLPLLRLRTLLDLGEVDRTAALLLSLEHQRPEALLGEPAQAEYVRAELAYKRGDPRGAEERLRRLVDAHQEPRDRVGWAPLLSRLGRHQQAVDALLAVLTEIDATAQPALAAAAHNNLAEAQRSLGQLETAESNYEKALTLYRSLGHVRHAATAHNNLGVMAKDRANYRDALEHLRRAQALFAHVQDRHGAALTTANLGVVSLEAGDPQAAVRRLRGALDDLQRLGSRRAQPLLLVLLARAHAACGDAAEATASLDRAGPLTEGRLMDEAEKVRMLLNDARANDRTEVMTEPPSHARDPERRELDGIFRMFVAINRRLATEADLEQAMRFLLDAAVTLTGGRLGYLLIKRPDGLRLELRTGQANDAVVAYSRSVVNRAIQQRQVLTADDALADRDLAEMPSVRGLRRRSAICVPFVSAAGVEGAIYVEHPGRTGVFGEIEKERLDVLADQAAIAVDRMLHEERLAAELERSRRDLQVAQRALRTTKAVQMVGRSKPMTALREEISRLAKSDLSVLILGETGSGKELVARALHEESPRVRGAFVAENCSSIPAELMESELFGHRRGAFTGADKDKVGLMELASGGTLFLDEVGDMPADLQVKLLRVLQEGCIRRVGDQKTIPIDLRLIAATHRELPALIENGEFRADLYYRVAAAEVRVPPLRARGKDVLLLAESVLSELNQRHRRSVRLTEAACRQLQDYTWPGNVRELRHVIERAFLLSSEDELASFPLPAATLPAAPRADGAWPVISLAEAEEHTIRAALRATDGEKAKAARILKVSRTALYAKLERMEKRRTDP